MTEEQEKILNSFKRKIQENTAEEPPEVRRKIDEHIWDLFGDEEVFEDPPKLSVTIEWSDIDDCYMAVEHNRDISAFADSPADAMRELATAIELRQEAADQE
jgi:predicted RNase H-like HicB family nuclease